MKALKKILFCSGIILVAAPIQSCTTGGSENHENELKISDSPGPAAPAVAPEKSTTGTVPLGKGKASESIAWFSCLLKKTGPAVVLAHDETQGFKSKDFCNLPESQAFLASGLHVIGFNRPGFAPSTGKVDLVGQASQQAGLLAIKAAMAKSAGRISLIEGTYGFGTGAAAAAFLAKQSGGLKWLIAGGGIYDFEVTANDSASPDLKKAIANMVNQEGDEAFEIRSIAYDINGLPNRVALFRGRDDTSAPASQADSFRAGLAANQYKVTFQEIAGIGASIEPRQLRQILDVMIASVR